ncbi:MAG: hypothetical protein U1E70_13745 [Acetobacteraceae bacterium]
MAAKVMSTVDDLAGLLSRTGVFDAKWYATQNPDVVAAGMDPLDHFIHYGSAEGRAPNRYFDAAWYRDSWADVASSGFAPLLHYLRHGEAEGRRPHPHFDPAWYRAAYGVAPAASALGHFIGHRTRRALSPTPDLFAVPFITPYCGTLAAGGDPIAQYLDDVTGQGSEAFPDPGLIAASGLLDENYYLINGSDVHAADIDPVSHYCRYGWRERRRPNIYFDPVWYAQTNPEVARLQVNPLLHYLVVGEAANRRPVPYFDPGWYRREYDVPADQPVLAHFLRHRRSQNVSPTPLFDIRWYVSRFAAELGSNRDPFAHYLQAGMTRDIDPNPGFDAAHYRRTHIGRPSRGFASLLRPDEHNPLVHYLRAQYAAAVPSAKDSGGKKRKAPSRRRARVG